MHLPELGATLKAVEQAVPAPGVDKALGEGNNVAAVLLKAGELLPPELAELRVLKLIKADSEKRSVPHADEAQRQQMADEIASTADKLRARSAWLGEIIPRVVALDVGAVLQEPALGLSYSELDPKFRALADQEIKAAVAEAERLLPAWSFTRSPENYLFHPDGRIRAWFDHLADTTGGPRPAIDGGVHIQVLQRSYRAREKLDAQQKKPQTSLGPPPVDRYQLESGTLEGGTSAAVNPGIDLKTKEKVVIKRMHVPHQPALDHAKNEIGLMKTLADSRSPQLSRLRCAGFTKNGPLEQPWLVMDRGGAPISTNIRVLEPRPAPLAVGIVLHALRGLQAMHDRGIAHRDIHPQNILVSRDASGAEDPRSAMLIDYGQGVRLAHDGRWHVNNGGGNPEYLPPEQLSHGPSILDATADTFQCGAICAALIQGTPPFPGTVTHPYFSPEWCQAWLELHKSGPQLGGIADPKLAAVLKKALSADPNDRYSSEALIDALLPFAPPGLVLPPRDPLRLPDKSLVQEANDPRVLVVIGGAPLWIPNPSALTAMGFAGQPIQILPPGSLARMRHAPADGSLVQELDVHAIYLMSRGKKVWIPNPQTFEAMGLDWSHVRIVPPGALAAIKDGSLER